MKRMKDRSKKKIFKRKLSFSRIFEALCLLSIVLLCGFYSFTTFYIKSYNISLSLKVQEIEARNEKLKAEITENEQNLIKAKKVIKQEAQREGIYKDIPQNIVVMP